MQEKLIIKGNFSLSQDRDINNHTISNFRGYIFYIDETIDLDYRGCFRDTYLRRPSIKKTVSMRYTFHSVPN